MVTPGLARTWMNVNLGMTLFIDRRNLNGTSRKIELDGATVQLAMSLLCLIDSV
jgi:hypothetical protein